MSMESRITGAAAPEGPGRLAGQTNVSEANRAQIQGQLLVNSIDQDASKVKEVTQVNSKLGLKEMAKLQSAAESEVQKNESGIKQLFGVPSGDSPSSSMSGIGAILLAIEKAKAKELRGES